MTKPAFSLSSLAWLKGGSVKSVFQDACKRYSLVYFGAVDHRHDEYELIRGVTLSPSHRDAHYCVGTVEGRDIILVHRIDTVAFPGKPDRTFRWQILQVDLKHISLPHVFLDAHHRDETFYAQLFAKFVRLTRVHPSVFAGHDAAFTDHHIVYTPPDSVDLMPRLLPPETTSYIGHHFHHFDYEVYQDHLLIYALDQPAAKSLIDQMIKAGLWLADQLEHHAPAEFHES